MPKGSYMQRIVIRASIWALIGLTIAIIMGTKTCNDITEFTVMILFWPVYFVGIGFCRWSLIGKTYLVILGIHLADRRDKFHILTTMAGALVLAYIVVFGWLIGIIRFGAICLRRSMHRGIFHQQGHGL